MHFFLYFIPISIKHNKKMKKLLSILLLSAFCTLATGCGVKGPLYFPEKEQPQNTQKTQ